MFRNKAKDVEVSNSEDRLINSAYSFIEELVVRRELAENYCYYNSNYNNINGLKPWALNTLIKHSKDKRKYIYTLQRLEEGNTFDLAWNSAQKQLTTSCKIHGYMRMYWAKKVLEWTKTPEIAIKYLIYLNDKYHIDGNDPNGYVGILWSIGGLHDRAWFEEIFMG